MSEVSRNANAYTIQEENSTTYCTPRIHPGETPTAGPRCLLEEQYKFHKVL